MGQIIIENRLYSFEDIRAGKYKEEDLYYTHALGFCQSWLTDQQSFELQTSGSTGMPKNILITRSQMEVSAMATRDFFRISANPNLLCCLNTWFIAGKMMLVRGMEWNACIYLSKPSQNPFKESSLIQKYELVAMVPLQVLNCIDDTLGLQGLKAIKNLIIGGAPSSHSLIEKLLAASIHAYQTYGMTETVSHVALAPIEGKELQYEVLPGVIIGVDENNRLWIEAPMAEEKQIQTNDLVKILSPTRFQWLGRADFTINSGGVKVQPELIEKAIEPLVVEKFGDVAYFIGGLTDEQLGQKVVLIVEKTDPLTDEQSFLKKLADNLPRYHQPKEIHYLKSFVRTATGKVNRISSLSTICSS
ncbi:AMP-binding protein [Mongoliitalea daihaiensis]|uniref:AMP-binding protein n=1 Tax=Mongoliitalea daihaiensis TaxID=2782006 RepID=UPI001F1C9A2F|nr:AMP-binding protein [Mongoliitalea daihaiensis]UJP64585.1 AMP-binding protein [Mongoliitalea daihaiensis]